MKKDIRDDIQKARNEEDKGLALVEKLVPVLEAYFHIRVEYAQRYYWYGTEKKPFLGLDLHRDRLDLVGNGDNSASLKKKDRALLDELLLKHGIYTMNGWRGSISFFDEDALKKTIHGYIENTKQANQRYDNEILNLKKKQALMKANPELFDTDDRNEVFRDIEYTQNQIITNHKELKRINRILSKSQDNLLKLMAILD